MTRAPKQAATIILVAALVAASPFVFWYGLNDILAMVGL